MTTGTAYPIAFEVDYPERQTRWKALLRPLLVLPVVIFSFLVVANIAFAIWAAVLVRGRIPRWLFDFQVALNRWQLRAASYALLLTDEYPPFEGGHPIRYDVQDPGHPARWKLVVWKFISGVPHFFALAFLTLTLVVVWPIGWLAIIITGRFPRTLHWYAAGVLRWWARVQAYTLSLTDEFPPFSLSAQAGPGGRIAFTISSLLGAVATGGALTVFVLAVLEVNEVTREVPYQRLLEREVSAAEARVRAESAEAHDALIELRAASDPADDLFPFLAARAGHRFVLFELVIDNTTGDDLDISTFQLRDDGGKTHGTYFNALDGRIGGKRVEEDDTAALQFLFELPDDVDPAELRLRLGHHVHRTVIYRFR